MRIATWNVAYGRGRAANDRRLRRIAAVDADVWVLTETHDLLSLAHLGFSPVLADQRPTGDLQQVVEGGRWVTIWSRYPVREQIVGLADPRRTVAAVIVGTVTDVVVYGTVLPWLNDREVGDIAAVAVVQGAEWMRLRAAHGDLCVAGDFNVNLGGPHYYGSRAGKAAVRSALDSADLVAMTDFAHTPERDFGLVDHIAVPASAAARSSRGEIWGMRSEDDEYLSDHPGVAIDVAAW